MRRGFGVSMALVLLLISGAFAVVEQGQVFGISATNDGQVGGAGIGGMASVNVVPLTNIQSATDGGGVVQVSQVGLGSLHQSASVAGLYGLYGFNQSASALGQQNQASLGFLNPGVQAQDMGTTLGQSVYGSSILGSAVASQSFIGAQNQIITTPYGVQVNVQCLGIGLVDRPGRSAMGGVNRTVTINRGLAF